MNDREAAGLARLLVAAFPDSGATAETVAVYARRLAAWPDAAAAERAIDRAIDEFRRLPSIRDLRDAYAVEAGEPDPGRDMSPAVPDLRPMAPPAEQREIRKMIEALRLRLTDLEEGRVRVMSVSLRPGKSE